MSVFQSLKKIMIKNLIKHYFKSAKCAVKVKFLHKGRKIALVVDNYIAHTKVNNLEAIEIIYLPPNVTFCSPGIFKF